MRLNPSLLIAWIFISGVLSWSTAYPNESHFPSLNNKPLSAAAQRGFAFLAAGKSKEARATFELALKKDPTDAPAHFGLAMQLDILCERQQSLEHYAQSIEHGRLTPLAEVFVSMGMNGLSRFPDRQPMLQAARKLIADPQVRPALKDLILLLKSELSYAQNNHDQALACLNQLQFIRKWALIGPFDNRDRAGLSVVYAPETKLDLESVYDGRNRSVSWYIPNAEPANGYMPLSELMDPNIHSIAYGLAGVHLEQDTWVNVHLGCAGAARVWVNEQEVMAEQEYNEYVPYKHQTPAYLHKGWNLILVKSGVVEETGWAFSIRLSLPQGGPLPNFKSDISAEVLAAYAQAKPNRQAPPQQPAFEPTLLQKLETELQKDSQNPWLNLLYGYCLHYQKRGDVEDDMGADYYEKAIRAAPNSALFPLFFASATSDPNKVRIALELAVKQHDDLPMLYEQLANLAVNSGLVLQTETYSRLAISKFGPQQAAHCVLLLANILRERGYVAEAYNLLLQIKNTLPYDENFWQLLTAMEISQTHKVKLLEEALTYCGGSDALRSAYANELLRMEQDEQAATFVEAGLALRPYAIDEWVGLAETWRRIGGHERASAVLEKLANIAPNNVAVLTALGNQALYKNDRDNAIAYWSKALSIRPNSPDLKDRLVEISKGKGIDREFFAPFDIALKDLPIPSKNDFPEDHVVTLLNQQVVKVNPNGTSSVMVHLIAKLLRPAGFGKIRSHTIPFDPQRQVVDILRAAVITPDGREVSQAAIRERTVSAAMGVQTRIYDEYYLKEIVFPDMEPGAIVDLQYTIRDTGGNIYGDYFSSIFYLGDEQPVIRSEYILDLPREREFKTATFRLDLQPQELATADSNRKILKWAPPAQPGIVQEPIMPPPIDFVPFVQATTMKSWQDVGIWYWNLAQDTLKTNEKMEQAVKEIIAGAKTDTEKLRAIHDWVIKKIRYLGIEFGRNGYKPHRATETFDALYGDCKDTAVLITAMLKLAGIDSKLVLVRTTDAGKVEPDALPGPNLFNHCIAYVPNVEGREYWVDCTTDFHQLGEVPYADQGANVLVVGPEGGKFMTIPFSTAEENLSEEIVKAEIAADGSATISIRELQHGQFAGFYRGKAETPGQFKRYMQEVGAQRFTGAELLKLKYSEPEEQGPMWSEVEYRVSTLANRSGDGRMLDSTLQPLQLARRYTAQGGERKHELRIWFPWSRKSTITYLLDEHSKIRSLPENSNLDDSFGSFLRTVRHDGREIKIEEHFKMKSHRVLQEQYKAFSEFCRKIDALQNQRVIFSDK